MSANEDELLKKFKAEADEKRSEVIKKVRTPKTQDLTANLDYERCLFQAV